MMLSPNSADSRNFDPAPTGTLGGAAVFIGQPTAPWRDGSLLVETHMTLFAL